MTRIELAAARIELNQATGRRADLASKAAALGEPDSLSAELDVLRSSAVELAGELAACRHEARSDAGEEPLVETGLGESSAGSHETAPVAHGASESAGPRRSGGRRRNADLERVAKLLDQTEDSPPADHAG